MKEILRHQIDTDLGIHGFMPWRSIWEGLGPIGSPYPRVWPPKESEKQCQRKSLRDDQSTSDLHGKVATWKTPVLHVRKTKRTPGAL